MFVSKRVETVVRALRKPLVGRTVTSFTTDWERAIKAPSTLAEFASGISNQRVKSISRRAKWIVIGMESAWSLIVHLRMSGHLFVCPADAPVDKHVHGRFRLDNGDELRFKDTRKFGTLHWLPLGHSLFDALAPEPLDRAFTPAVLKQRLERWGSSLLKPLLLKQDGVCVGLGNIYADEVLFEAKLHPERKAGTLDDAQISALHGAIRNVLQLAIEREGTSFSTYLLPSGEKGSMQEFVKVFQRTDEPCTECEQPIKRIKMAQRSTHFCEDCQD